MIHTLKLLLPALIPSWNFFDIIAASPRIEFCTLDSVDASADNWLAYRPRPAHVSFWRMLARMVWNPYWNESLFLMSCAERLLEYPTLHSEMEILNHIRDSQMRAGQLDGYIRFRLILIQREGDELTSELTSELAYESDILEVATGTTHSVHV